MAGSGSWWEKVLGFIGFEEIEELVEPIDEEHVETATEEAQASGFGGRTHRRTTGSVGAASRPTPKPSGGDQTRRGSLVSLPASDGRFKLVVTRPREFSEVEYIADHIKGRRPVILNLESIEKEDAQKLVNFLSGAIFALDGEMQRIGTHILLFTPLNVDVSIDDVREGLDELS